MKPIELFDKMFQKRAENLAVNTSRRSFIGKLGIVLVGAAAIPLLPVARYNRAHAAEADDAWDSEPSQQSGRLEQPGDLWLLGELRDRRMDVRLLRRVDKLMPSRFHTITDNLDWHLQES